ncbi:unnamed protein product [Cuscuta campestris]|uniref:Retrotransposon Copia-like N-terminal domain-containing protein n=1 Tax=Cuscuta campestris TaxID=132261 RepID=A0A484KEJ3_9ASTE|nr:unnamed protein product [Cuscuta campestris]
MAAENPSTRASIDIQSELYLHPTESPSFLLASEKLNSKNFPQWKRSAEIALSARNKLGFVNGSSKAPESLSPLFAQWNRCNNLVISWILHSVESGIANSVLYCETAREIWDDLAERFGQTNAPKLFQLHKEIITLVQGSDSISEYFTKLKGLWDVYLKMMTLQHCRCDGAGSYMKLIQDQQLLQFLMELNDSFKTARGNILMMKPLPTLNQAYKLITQEETQRDCSNSVPMAANSSALASMHHTSSIPSNKPVYGTTPSERKSKFFCQHCKIYGHSLDRCFKVHGYPKNNKGNGLSTEHNLSQGRKVAGNVFSADDRDMHGHNIHSSQASSSVELPMTLINSQYNQLIALLSKDSSHDNDDGIAPGFLSTHLASSAHLAGNSHCFFSSYDNSQWIIDSGASDHISPHISNFSSYKPILNLVQSPYQMVKRPMFYM